jgi:prepilin peptidase CpaA
MIVAALSDVTFYRIPNWLTGLIALLFFPMAWMTGMPLAEFGWHVAAGLILFVAGYLLFASGLFGGGDAKLMAAAGLWFGTGQTVQFLMLTALAGGVLALAFGAWALIVFVADFHADAAKLNLSQRMQKLAPKLPYGFALAVGAILAFPQTWWMNLA